MIDDVLAIVAEDIKTANSIYLNSFVGGRIVQDGKQLKYANREATYTGLMDTQGNYFYIRYDGLINASIAPDSQKMTSCTLYSYNVPIKLVSWIIDANSDKVAKALLYDLSTIKVQLNGYQRISEMQIRSIEMDREAVIRSELGKDIIDTIPPGLSLVAINFSITVIPTMN